MERTSRTHASKACEPSTRFFILHRCVTANHEEIRRRSLAEAKRGRWRADLARPSPSLGRRRLVRVFRLVAQRIVLAIFAVQSVILVCRRMAFELSVFNSHGRRP